MLVPLAPPGMAEEHFVDKRPLYNAAEATAEANRCLYCVDAPCIAACPTEIDIPTFIHKLATGNVKGAARTILNANILGQSCGQACPVEVLCAGACVYNAWGREPIAIGRLQRFGVEAALRQDPGLFKAQPATGKRIALLGSGPASVAAAGMLALAGHSCVLFEKKRIPGGLNSLGIAPYKMKLPEALKELNWVLSLGDIELRTDVEVVAGSALPGQVSAQTLLETFDGVFLGLGLGVDARLGIEGEDGAGVYGAVQLIELLKSRPGFSLGAAKRALIIGGGNTAIDIAHELVLLGWESSMVYRREANQMSGYGHELNGAREHGVRLLENRRPLAVLRGEGGEVTGLEVALTQGKEAKETLPADLIVVAIGQSKATQVALGFPGVALDSRGCVVVDPATHRTHHPRVWSGGDCVNGGREVVNAAAEAKLAVRDMQRFLREH